MANTPNDAAGWGSRPDEWGSVIYPSPVVKLTVTATLEDGSTVSDVSNRVGGAENRTHMEIWLHGVAMNLDRQLRPPESA